ncbi:hypothetical protein PLICRDRAFT_39431 [Plicaturopsis crispa FD-325 SS-3]|nr:hypothetical protein PLICRDRAFT_39431 [Plicaturopsis crispa FD-325 SS-3]
MPELMLSFVLLSVAIAQWTATASFVSPHQRPLELAIVRDPSQDPTCKFVHLRETQLHRGLSGSPDSVIHDILSIPSPTLEDAFHTTEHMRIYSYDEETAWNKAVSLCEGGLEREDTRTAGASQAFFEASGELKAKDPHNSPAHAPLLEVEPLVTSGPSRNRVDLVFFSDGYLSSEKGKFLEDAARLAEDISGNQTFNTVRPLLNFWAAFTPSNESGVGVGGKPKDTPFGLYRDGTELRGVYYDKPAVARAACSSLGDQCDFPILLGNDPLYGGLGGEFTVITSSLANGPLVLRHELGHSIIDVGEEYDGGTEYFGPNAAANVTTPVPWAHWIDAPNNLTPRVERAVMPLQKYAWAMLNTTSPWSVKFNGSGLYHHHIVRFSLSGIPHKDDLRVEADGVNLHWVPKEGINDDRWHYDIAVDGGWTDGEHEVKFTLLNRELEGKAQLCSVESLDYGNPDEFVDTPGYYGIFPTFSETNVTSYRPTNEDCLMRIVTSPNFCKACTEGLWLSLLRRMELIDDVQEGCEWHPSDNVTSHGTWTRTLDLKLVPLAQFRDEQDASLGEKESYEIVWKKDGKVLDAFANSTRAEVADSDGVGVFDIEVKFTTEEVRVDSDGLLVSAGEYRVMKRCSV